MLAEWLKAHFSPEQAKSFLYMGQVMVGIGFVLAIVFLRKDSHESAFRVREADRVKPNPAEDPRKLLRAPADDLASAKMKRNEPLQLAGIRIDGAPHQILGISPQAGEKEIQSAFRELMKRYHPDKVGPQGSREWKDAQKIAEAIIRAKEEMLKRHQSQNPNRSGR